MAKKLAGFEPFRAAIAISKRRKTFTAEEVSDSMARKEVYLHVDERENVNLITTILLQWAIEFGLLAYDGERKVWSRKAGSLRVSKQEYGRWRRVSCRMQKLK